MFDNQHLKLLTKLLNFQQFLGIFGAICGGIFLTSLSFNSSYTFTACMATASSILFILYIVVDEMFKNTFKDV